jgi:hypothetical protein
MSKIKGSLHCCGSTLSVAKTYIPSRSKGIHVFRGAVGIERDDDKVQLKHVQTKHGVVTIAIRPANNW